MPRLLSTDVRLNSGYAISSTGCGLGTDKVCRGRVTVLRKDTEKRTAIYFHCDPASGKWVVATLEETRHPQFEELIRETRGRRCSDDGAQNEFLRECGLEILETAYEGKKA